MTSTQIATQASQINTFGPATSLPTSCSLLPQNEQRSLVLNNRPIALLIPVCPSVGARGAEAFTSLSYAAAAKKR